MPKKLEIRMFEIMNECSRVDVNHIINWLNGIKCKYLIVKHDMDTPREPHYHVFVKMDNKRWINDIAIQCKIEKQYIERIKGWKNALGYAFHLTEGAKNDGKHIYNESAIIGSRDIDIDGIFRTAKEYEENREREKQLNELLFKYGECEISKDKLFENFNAKDYVKYAIKFKRLQEYRIMKVRNRNMEVVYITGVSGSGKTTLAKYMARMLNYDTFVSGSGKDVLDGYDKEECIILDDLRGDIFSKAELFKLTDNNTNSSVKSRFKNKDISYCKLMIITSIKTPDTLYNWQLVGEDKDETFNQFARRLQYKYLDIKHDGTILECKYDLDCKKVKVDLAPVNMTMVFNLLGIDKVIGPSLVDNIFSKIREDVKNKKESYETEKDLPF